MFKFLLILKNKSQTPMHVFFEARFLLFNDFSKLMVE